MTHPPEPVGHDPAGWAHSALASTELLLAASEDLSAATTLAGVSEAVERLLTSAVAPDHVSVGVAHTADGQHRIHVPNVVHPQWEAAWLHDVAGAASPLLRSLRDNEPVFYATPAALAADFPDLAGDLVAADRQALTCLPLPGPDGPIGILAFWWAHPHDPDVAERVVLTALAGYAGLAVQRVLLLQERIDVAQTLQRAMLTELPSPAGLGLAARYLPAHAGDQVGGDWYDAFSTRSGAVILVIGDVAGHDITAAAQMGQVRSMLRVLGHDRDEEPGEILTRTDAAIHGLGVDTLASAVVARLTPATGPPGGHLLHWSTAGHPPPLLAHADGRVDVLAGSDTLLGFDPGSVRRTTSTTMPPGSTLLLYTDGLVEQRGEDLRDSIAKLRDLLGRLHDRPLEELLDTLIDILTGHTHDDDIAMIACRTP